MEDSKSHDGVRMRIPLPETSLCFWLSIVLVLRFEDGRGIGPDSWTLRAFTYPRERRIDRVPRLLEGGARFGVRALVLYESLFAQRVVTPRSSSAVAGDPPAPRLPGTGLVGVAVPRRDQASRPGPRPRRERPTRWIGRRRQGSGDGVTVAAGPRPLLTKGHKSSLRRFTRGAKSVGSA